MEKEHEKEKRLAKGKGIFQPGSVTQPGQVSRSKGIVIGEQRRAQSGASSGSGSEGTIVVQSKKAGQGGKDAAAAASSGKKKLPSKRTSTVWKHFDLVVDGNDSRAYCKYCPKNYPAGSSKYGTSTLKLHIEKCDKNPEKIVTDLKQAKLGFHKVGKGKGKEGELVAWHFNQQVCRSALTKMLVLDELAFRFVDGEGFHHFVSACCPMFVIPSRYTMIRDIYKLYEAEKLKLFEYFRNSKFRVSFTTDTWTSVQQVNYTCITAHFIDDAWVLHKKNLNFCPITSHRGEDIGRAVETCLNAWGLDNIMTITVDNASPNKDAIEYLRVQLNQRMLCSNLFDGIFMHMRCVAHILNLIVNDGLKEVDRSIERIRVAVRFIRHSPMRLSRFKNACVLAGYKTKRLLSVDVSTRWNSTYLMLHSACRLENAFHQYSMLDPCLNAELDFKVWKKIGSNLGRLTQSDWVVVKSLMKFLETFFCATVRISGSSYATSNVILDEISDINLLIKEGLESDNLSMRNMSSKMNEKFNKYFRDLGMLNMFTFLAPIFDPRKKLSYVNYLLEDMYPAEVYASLSQCVKVSLDDMFAHYKTEFGVDEPETQPDCSDSVGDQVSKHRNFEKFKRLCSSRVGAPQNELETYLNEQRATDSSEFKVLSWWADNAHRFPILARMARDILAIPMTSVSSESAFSAGSRVLDAFRSSLSTRVVQALICTQDWLKGINVIQTLASMEKDEDMIQDEEDVIDTFATTIGAPVLL